MRSNEWHIDRARRDAEKQECGQARPLDETLRPGVLSLAVNAPVAYAERVDVGQPAAKRLLPSQTPPDAFQLNGWPRSAATRPALSNRAAWAALNGLGGRVKPPCRATAMSVSHPTAQAARTSCSIQRAASPSGTRALKRTTAMSGTTFSAPPPSSRATFSVTQSRSPLRTVSRRASVCGSDLSRPGRPLLRTPPRPERSRPSYSAAIRGSARPA